MSLREQELAKAAAELESGEVGDLTDTQSYSWILNDWIYSQLVADPFFAKFAVKRIVAALPVELWEQVPFLGVFAGDEALATLGPLNMSNINLTHRVPIGFQIILRHNDPTTLLQYLDQTSWHIMKYLLRLDDLTNRLHSELPGNTRIEGVERGRIRNRWGLAGSKNETPVGERQLDFTFVFNTEWWPYGFDDLERITVRTGFPIGGTAEEVQKIEQVTMVYEFNPDSVPYPLPPDTEPPPDPFPLPHPTP